VTAVALPAGLRWEPLRQGHPRKQFRCGEALVDDWLATKALQQQQKRLSTTKVLIDANDRIVAFHTLATGQVDFGDLPADLTRRLPHRALPVAILAWLGIDSAWQGQGLGERVMASALRDCHDASRTFAFVAVVIDCLNDSAKSFYQRWDFAELPGCPNRLFLSAQRLEAMMTA
jgi:GNAT superfamily N-acetyltransferase